VRRRWEREEVWMSAEGAWREAVGRGNEILERKI